jgi:hypothetical protein
VLRRCDVAPCIPVVLTVRTLQQGAEDPSNLWHAFARRLRGITVHSVHSAHSDSCRRNSPHGAAVGFISAQHSSRICVRLEALRSQSYLAGRGQLCAAGNPQEKGQHIVKLEISRRRGSSSPSPAA